MTLPEPSHPSLHYLSQTIFSHSQSPVDNQIHKFLRKKHNLTNGFRYVNFGNAAVWLLASSALAENGSQQQVKQRIDHQQQQKGLVHVHRGRLKQTHGESETTEQALMVSRLMYQCGQTVEQNFFLMRNMIVIERGQVCE